MKTFSSDFAYRAAEQRRNESMGLTLAGKVWLAYGIVLGVSAFTFILAVVESAK